jgi:uncharacterized protein YhaN
VNILLAPNSAGKSVLRGAFVDLLFGIHDRTEMDFRFGYSGMKVTAEIVQQDGSPTTFSRRKTRGNVITGPDDQPLDPGFLHGILGGRDRKLLERLFVLDTEALREGGRALLESGGDVASALLSAAGGIRQARSLKRELERKRDELAPERRTSSRPFYQALDQFLQARRLVSSETIRPDTWFHQQHELEELEEHRRQQNLAAEAASADIARLERVRRVRRWLAQLVDAKAWLETHPDAPRLGPEPRKALEAARLDSATKTETARLAAEALEHAERNASDVVVNTNLLGYADQIKQLVDEAGGARTAQADLPGRRAEYDFCLARIRDLLRQLGSDLPPERAAEALQTRALLARTRQRIKEYAELAAAAQGAPERIAAREHELAERERQLAELPADADHRILEVLLQDIRVGGNPATRRQEAEKSLAECDAALSACLARVPSWSAGGDALAALTSPAIDVWRRLDADIAEKRAEVTTSRERLEDETAKLEQAQTELATLSAGGTIPDDIALGRARLHRDSGWRLIYRRAFTSDPPAAAEEHEFAADVPLPLAFERAINEADAIADRRAVDSEFLGRVEAARHAVTEAERRTETAKQRARLAEEALNQTRRAWVRLCKASGQGEDAELPDIQTFLTAREQVIETLQRRSAVDHALKSLVLRQEEWARALAATLGEQQSDLGVLLGLADRALSQAARRRQTRTDLETLRTQAIRELRDAVATQAAANTSLEAWRERWRGVLAELGRPEIEEPAETEAVLQTIGDIQTELRDMSSLMERIGGMNARIERFTSSVQEIYRQLPGLIEFRDPFGAVRELDRRLDQERASDQRHRILRDSLDKARAAAAAATQELMASQVQLHAVLTLIGADTIEAAAQRLALSDERAAFELRRDEAEAELRHAGDGYSTEVLRIEAAQHHADEDAARIEAASARHKEANEAAQRAAADASRMRQGMDQQAEATGVNAAAADQQAAIALLSRTLDEALLYHTASLLLSQALDAVEQSGGSGMLRRLSTIFQKLTCDLYVRVTSEPDDTGKADLVMIQRDFPDERQRIGQLSEGTRDQLFLALRMAAIEDHLESAEPLPFIGDDILQTFDDDRALAALRVLSDLSRRTQVIVLTHHRHVLDLADRLPDGTLFACQREPVATTT